MVIRILLAFLMLAVPVTAGAQPATKRIGILGDQSADPSEKYAWDVFRYGLRDHGWKEGGNLGIEYRWVEGQGTRLPELAAELVRLKPDVLVTRGSFFTGALKAATSTIPIVFLGHADPVGTGHVASLAKPGGNLTGTAILQTELGPKGLELLHAAVPASTRIAVLWHQGTPSAVPGLKALEAPAQMLGLKLQRVGARNAGELETAFATMEKGGAQAALVLSTVPFINARQKIAELAIAHRLPTMGQGRQFVEAGALMSYYPRQADYWRRSAYFVDRILKGATPAELPVGQPTVFELIVNARSANALGLTIPPAVLERADQIIK
jgi:putative ABC transport system substrate-binding protein